MSKARLKPGRVLNPGRVACPRCDTVQFVTPNVRQQSCKICHSGILITFAKGQAVSVFTARK